MTNGINCSPSMNGVQINMPSFRSELWNKTYGIRSAVLPRPNPGSASVGDTSSSFTHVTR